MYGNDVKAVGQDGSTLLHYAIGSGLEGVYKRWNIAVVKYLVFLGADVNAKNYSGTPLHHIFDIEFVAFFISKGADVNAKNSCDDTPLHRSVWWKGNFETVKYLVSKGANVNAKNNLGNTPFLRAGSVEIAQFLISKGADFNTKNDSGFRLSPENKTQEMHKLILEKMSQ